MIGYAIHLMVIGAMLAFGLSTTGYASNADFINRGVDGADVNRPDDMGADFVNRGVDGADVNRGVDGADVNRGVDGADVNRGVDGADVSRPYY